MSTTLVEMFRVQVAASADRAALRTRASGLWIERSWREWDETSLAVAAALMDLGVRPGERVAILASTRREWAEVDVGIALAGAVSVPLYPQTLPAGVAHILADAECSVVFAEDPHQIEKLFDPRAAEAMHNVRRVVCFDAHRRLARPDAQGRLEIRLEDVLPRAARSRVMGYGELLEAGRRALDRDSASVRARGNAVTPGDLATLMYTSGTSGPPRGVAITHANIAFECATVGEQLELTTADEQMLLLPLAHVFGRVLLMCAIRVGFATSFPTSPLTALDDLREAHPTFFGAVPRLFESVYSSVQRRLGEESRVRRQAAARAFRVGARVAELRRLGKRPGPVLGAEHRIAQMAVLERVRHTFGRRLRFAISGGAPLSREIAEWFHACDVLLLEGYGLTETTAATHVNRPGGFRFGTVGCAVPGVETKLATDGEVLVRGGNVTPGYWKLPEATAAALDEDGWFHTGDVGTIDPQGYLTITDRKKDLIVTAGGKNVAPQNLEAALRRDPWISQAAVFGDRRPYLVALLTLDETTARAWAREHKLDLSWPEIVRDARVHAFVERAVEALNRDTEGYQQIRRWALIERDFTEDQSELTATQKLRRRAIAERHAAQLEALYARDASQRADVTGTDGAT